MFEARHSALGGRALLCPQVARDTQQPPTHTQIPTLLTQQMQELAYKPNAPSSKVRRSVPSPKTSTHATTCPRFCETLNRTRGIVRDSQHFPDLIHRFKTASRTLGLPNYSAGVVNAASCQLRGCQRSESHVGSFATTSTASKI